MAVARAKRRNTSHIWLGLKEPLFYKLSDFTGHFERKWPELFKKGQKLIYYFILKCPKEVPGSNPVGSTVLSYDNLDYSKLSKLFQIIDFQYKNLKHSVYSLECPKRLRGRQLSCPLDQPAIHKIIITSIHFKSLKLIKEVKVIP